MHGNIKVGIIGAGEIAKYHIQILKEIPTVEVCAICDINLSKAQALAFDNDIKNSYDNHSKMFAEQKPDVIHVLTTPEFHMQLSCEAMESACHVLVEKPMALSYKDAYQMVLTAKNTKKHLAVCEMYLYDPVIIKARYMLQQGCIGKLIHVENYWFTNVSGDSTAYSLKGAGSGWAHSLPGGVFANFLDHPVYLQREFIGEIRSINTIHKKVGDNPFVDYDELRINLCGDNITGCIVSSLNAKPRVNFLRLYGTEGIITADMSNLTVTTLKSRRLPSFITKGLNNLTQSYELARDTIGTTTAILRKKIRARQGLRNFVNTFYKQLQNTSSDLDDSLIFNFEKASVTIKILEDIWDSIQFGNIKRNRLKNNSYIDCRHFIPDRKEEKQKKGKALVTGASGFLGKHLVEELLKKDYTVRVVIRKINERFEKNKNIEVFYGDIRNPEVSAKATKEIDTVYHCAALTTNKGPWRTFHENNIEATRNLLEASKKFSIRKFVFVSTVAVYGFKKNKNNKNLCENDELGRGLPFYSYYAYSKIEAEKLIWEYYKNKNLPVVVLRPGIIFGPNGKKASQRRKIIFGAKRKILPYIFVKDVVKAMILAGDSDVAIGKTYNLVYDDQPTQGEFNELKNRITGIKKAGLYLPRPVMFFPAYFFEFYYRKKKSNASPPFNIYHYKSIVRNLRYDNKKIKTELGWSPTYSIEDGIKETFEYVEN